MKTYYLYKHEDYSQLVKEVTSKDVPGFDQVTVRIECGHIRGSEFVGVRIFVHVWENGAFRTGYFRAQSIREGWRVYRELCHLYYVGV